ncbi:MAG: GNAT family N-acetyltransferase [Alphaproteobacteria bacterium]
MPENQQKIVTAHSLDNIIWQALTTRQAAFSRTHGTARKFIDDIGPLAGFSGDVEEGYESLAGLAGNGGVVAVFSINAYRPREGWSLVAEAPLVQMVREQPGVADAGPSSFSIVNLNAPDSGDMQELAALAKPGPFGPRTHELGNFFGIRDQGKLVAMAGERMKVPDHTEVSAVCTHPDHTGKGYAATLMSRVIAGIEARGETPFLHSRADNERALELYKRLGFCARWSGHFFALRRE